MTNQVSTNPTSTNPTPTMKTYAKALLIAGSVLVLASCSHQNLSSNANAPAAPLTWDTGPAMW